MQTLKKYLPQWLISPRWKTKATTMHFSPLLICSLEIFSPAILLSASTSKNKQILQEVQDFARIEHPVTPVIEGIPVVLANAEVRLDDDSLPGGIAGGVGDDEPNTVNATGVLGHDFGSDGVGSIAWVTD